MLRTFNCGIGMIVVVGRAIEPTQVMAGAARSGRKARSASARSSRMTDGEPVRTSRAGSGCHDGARKRRVAILISGRGSNMAVADRGRAARRTFPAEIALVLSNRPDAGGLARARDAGIAAAVVDHKAYPDREAFERALDEALRGARHRADLPCRLHARPDAVVRRALGRTDDQHPSVAAAAVHGPPHAPAGARGRRARPWLHGAFRHARARCRADHRAGRGAGAGSDTEETLAARVLRQEHALYPMALQLVASGRVHLQHGRVELEADWDEEAALVSPRAAYGKE